jgi:hypothetical protein
MTSPSQLRPALLAVSATQRGVFSAAQAYRVGYTQKEVQRLRAAKDLVTVRRGVYAAGRTYLTAPPAEQLRMRVAALALALTAPAVISHQTAASEHQLDLLEPDNSLLHVTRTGRSGTRHEAGVDHHIAELGVDDVVDVPGAPLPVTPLPRTAMDVARDTDRFECAVAVFDSVLRAGVPREDLDRELDRARSWPGARLASGALPIADGRAANPGESWSRVVLIRLGLEPLDLQVRLADDLGLIGYADFGWDGVIGEFDGKGKYGVGADVDPAQAGQIVYAEKLREDRIRRLGLGVARWGWAELYRPSVIAHRVRQAHASCGRQPGRAG